MKYESRLHEFLCKITKDEKVIMAAACNVKVHYIQRVARNEVNEPGFNKMMKICQYTKMYSEKYPERDLPIITIEEYFK